MEHVALFTSDCHAADLDNHTAARAADTTTTTTTDDFDMVRRTRLVAKLPPCYASPAPPAPPALAGDSDSDLDDLPRRGPPSPTPTNPTKLVVNLQHAVQTPLEDVGLQLWPGALLLADFVLHHSHSVLFDPARTAVLELGGGTGLLTLVAATTARRAVCTDTPSPPAILENAQRNVDLFVESAPVPLGELAVRALDWTQTSSTNPPPPPPLHADVDPAAALVDVTAECGAFRWRDAAELDATLGPETVLLAADTIYDDELTTAFVRLVHGLLAAGRAAVCFVSLEKRPVFTMSAARITCPMYDHFMDALAATPALRVTPIPTDTIPAFFSRHYDRHERLVIFKLELSR